MVRLAPMIRRLDVSMFRIATEEPESDGTLSWDHTDIVVVQAEAGGEVGLGWTYASRGTAELVVDLLRDAVCGVSALDVGHAWQMMVAHLRNAGVPGAGMMAVSAVDVALWDLKARLLRLPLVDLFGKSRDGVAIYGSGGFTSYSMRQLRSQLTGWVDAGLRRVKMKVGRNAGEDRRRVQAARRAIGETAELMVDANGAYSVKEARAMADRISEEARVAWFEEPRPSSDLEGMAEVRAHAPAGLEVAAGEYGDTPRYFLQMLAARAVDCLQADATRCGGYTGFLKVAALSEAFATPLSAHCAPQIHAHIGCAVPGLRHVEYFHDHQRVERMLFENGLEPRDGMLRPDHTRSGHALGVRKSAEQYRL